MRPERSRTRAGLAGLVAAGAFALGLGADAGHASERPGRVVRVERPQRREVFVPAGTFTMGIGEDEVDKLTGECDQVYPTEFLCKMWSQELTHMLARQVFVSAFWMDRLEVSVTDYRECIAAGGCEVDAMTAGDERYLSDTGPMVNVQWGEAQRFCHWRGGRLPTEAEWERAARGDGNGPWPWGTQSRPNDFNHGKPQAEISRTLSPNLTTGFLADLQGEPDATDGAEILAAPGTYPWGDGPYGTLDQAGNVAEWTADAYLRPQFNSDTRRLQGSAGYDNLDTVNPRRDGASIDSRVVRGGSWRQPELVAHVNVRDPYYILEAAGEQIYEPTRRLPYVGFRCVRPAPDR